MNTASTRSERQHSEVRENFMIIANAASVLIVSSGLWRRRIWGRGWLRLPELRLFLVRT